MNINFEWLRTTISDRSRTRFEQLVHSDLQFPRPRRVVGYLRAACSILQKRPLHQSSCLENVVQRWTGFHGSSLLSSLLRRLAVRQPSRLEHRQPDVIRCDQFTSAMFGDFMLELSPCAGRHRRGKLKTSSLGDDDLHMGTIPGFKRITFTSS